MFGFVPAGQTPSTTVTGSQEPQAQTLGLMRNTIRSNSGSNRDVMRHETRGLSPGHGVLVWCPSIDRGTRSNTGPHRHNMGIFEYTTHLRFQLKLDRMLCVEYSSMLFERSSASVAPGSSHHINHDSNLDIRIHGDGCYVPGARLTAHTRLWYQNFEYLPVFEF